MRPLNIGPFLSIIALFELPAAEGSDDGAVISGSNSGRWSRLGPPQSVGSHVQDCRPLLLDGRSCPTTNEL